MYRPVMQIMPSIQVSLGSISTNGENKAKCRKAAWREEGEERREREKEVNLTFLDVYKKSVVCQLEVEQSNDLFSEPESIVPNWSTVPNQKR